MAVNPVINNTDAIASAHQVKLHSYACDCVTHHLFHPYGTNSLQKQEDTDMMEQVTTDDSLRSEIARLDEQCVLANPQLTN